MYIKSMCVDGFKSYGQRTEINGFDSEFNAITGLNGSGKSNILDAICFLLGISNLSQVRATNLQELVYKNGQAGVTKATVTITFDNRDKKQSPVGYEHYDEVTITRQVVIGGKNKYLINGTNVQNNRVQDFFRSVQLNVNNPHFLIMQGRITKVLNMKPPEILGMIEEAAGTRMYEAKKQQAQKTIEKKDAKLKEINDILAEEITPTLSKLKEERSMYLEYQKIQRELEHLTKIYIAFRFVTAQETSKKAKQEHDTLMKKIDEMNQEIKDGEEEVKDLENKITELQKKRDAETGGKLVELEKLLKEKEKLEAKAVSSQKNLKETIKAEEKKKKQLQKNLNEDCAALEGKKKEVEKLKDSFEKMRKADETDAQALEAAQKRFQAVSSGLFSSGDGEDATLQEQLIAIKKDIATAQTETKQAEMKLKHSRQELKKKQQEMKQTENVYSKDRLNLEKIEKNLKTFENELSKLNYEEGRAESLEEKQRNLKKDVFNLREKVESLEAKYPQLNFTYKDPEKNFNRSSVKGLACNMFKLKDVHSATALEVAAGGKLYNVIVDSEEVGKKLLKRGMLKNRVTLIPLNKIIGRSVETTVLKLAQNLVGRENVQPALSLIDYNDELHPAMEWIFGNVFICKDMDSAKKVAFHDRIMKKCVTLDGDVFDPSGTLTGGSRSKGSSLLVHLQVLQKAQDFHSQKQQELNCVESDLQNLKGMADRYNTLKQQYELKAHEVELIRQRLQQSTHHQQKEEVEGLHSAIGELEQTVKQCKMTENEGAKKVKSVEDKIKNAKALQDAELKKAQEEVKICKQKAEATHGKWKQKEQEQESLNLEIAELTKAINNGESQIKSTEEALLQYGEELKTLDMQVKELKDVVKKVQADVKAQKEALSIQNKEIHKMGARKDEIIKDSAETELEIKQMEHKVCKAKSEAKEAVAKVAEMLEKYEWIADDQRFFGQPNTSYDFQATDPKEAGQRIQKLEETKDKLGKNVNMRAMNMLGKAEEQYNDLMRKKRIVENDKAKIETVIRELDEKKKEALKQAWRQVNKDFGSIFSMLLPGTQAKLEPPEGQTVLDGLEVRIAFGGVWKESLGELSGGQRSLVALSLILAMLLFKPAPIYILDEVDAALDLSHTQNIGHMLKTHFKHSQFIVVSLKDGMFNNANVLFKTKFVDGMSTVTRIVQQQVPMSGTKGAHPSRSARK